MKTKQIFGLLLLSGLFGFTNPDKDVAIASTPQEKKTEQSSVKPDIKSEEKPETKSNTKPEIISEKKSPKELPANAAILFWSQLALLLIIIYFGIKFGGVALGMLGGLGVTLLVFIYGAEPAKPPIDVMLIILAVVTTSATLEATNALDLIVKFAERLLRNNPQYIVFLAPLSTFFLTMLMGTGHAVYPLLPVIYDVAIKRGVRPERPMAIASVASQIGITASPISAAAAATIGIFTVAGFHVGLIDILKVTVPASLIGILVAATWSLKRGKNLSDDPIFQERIKDEKQRNMIFGEMVHKDEKTDSHAGIALGLFLTGILFIVLIALFPSIFLPNASNGKPLPMSLVLQFVMLAVGSIILFLTRVSPKKISNSKVFNAGMVAVVMIFGIAWMSETVIEHNKPYILSLISDLVKTAPWMFAIAMFCVSAFLKSQAATLLVMMPLGISLGLSETTLIACIPACYAYFFFCFYPSDLATISFDRSGTTKVGSFIINHSFMIPGLISVWTATIIGFILVRFL